MDETTKARAIKVLRTPILVGHAHVPKVFVLGDKIFPLLKVAKAYQEEACPKTPMEEVTIIEAYEVQNFRQVMVKVNWNINNH